MVYHYKNKQGKTYYLHKMKGRDLYFFKTTSKAGVCDLPPGMMVKETETGLPVLKRS